MSSFNNPWLTDNFPTGSELDDLASNELKVGNKTKLYLDPLKSDETTDQIENLHYGNFAKQIMVSGVDFAKNFFDTFLVVSKEDSEKKNAFNELAEFSENNENLPDMWKAVGMYSFATRTTKVEIPQAKAQTFDISYSGNVIRKIKSEWDMQKRSSLSMRIDGLAYYVDAINWLSHNNDNSTLDNQKGISHLNIMGFNKRVAESLKDGARLDLIVRHVNLNENHSESQTNIDRSFYRESISNKGLVGMANTRPDNVRSMYWLFEDIKFLGWNEGLEFGNSTVGSQELTLDFIFKRLIRVDPMFLENFFGGAFSQPINPNQLNINSELKEILS